LKSRLEVQGNLMFEKLHYELGFPFKRVGVLVVAFSEEEMKTVEQLYHQGTTNGVPAIEICNAARIYSLEPGVNRDAVGGLFAPGGGIIEPYRFVFALTECARQNGVDIRTDFEVKSAAPRRGYWSITARSGDCVRARYAINAAGLYADAVSSIFGAEKFKILPRKGEEYLLDRTSAAYPNHVLFPVPAKNSKGVLVIPTPEGTTMVGPTAEDTIDKDDVSTTRNNLERIFNEAKHLVPAVSRRDIITSFAGLRPAIEGNNFYIDISRKAKRFIQVAGIQSPGLTASPAIAEYVKDLLKKAGLRLVEKNRFDPHVSAAVTARGSSPQEMAGLIGRDPRYGNIVCRCETVSEAEIVEAIHKGHLTLDGIKFYTRAGMGRCQGGFCSYKIMKIIARETGMDIKAITKRGGGSYEIAGSLAGGRESIRYRHLTKDCQR
jgi:glycerol-3-phosphate dehydrogenase